MKIATMFGRGECIFSQCWSHNLLDFIFVWFFLVCICCNEIETESLSVSKVVSQIGLDNCLATIRENFIGINTYTISSKCFCY